MHQGAVGGEPLARGDQQATGRRPGGQLLAGEVAVPQPQRQSARRRAERPARQLAEQARQVVARTLEASNREEKTDWGVIKEKIRADLKRYIVKETSRRPLIMPVILEI